MKDLSPSDRLSCWLLVGLLALSAALLTRNLGQPWNGLDGSNGALFSTIARNYLYFGPLELQLGQATNTETVGDRNKLVYYQHHPPLLPLMVAGAFALFGEGEAQARLGPVALTLGSIILVFLLGRRLYDDAIGLIAAFFFATFPGVLFFGRMAGYEAPTLFLVLLTVWCYLRFFDARSWRWGIAFYASLAAALWMDWPAFLLAPLLWLHHLAHARRPIGRDPVLLWLPVVSAGALGAFLYLAHRVDPTSFDDLVNQGLVYMGLLDQSHPLAHRFVETKATFTVAQYFKRVAFRVDLLFAYPVIILAGFGLWFARKDLDARRQLVLALLGVALAYSIVFYRSVFIHYWHTYYFGPPFAILAALAVRRLTDVRSQHAVPIGEGMRTRLGGPILALAIALVAVGILPRLAALYEIQLRVLPGDQHEQAMFVKELAAEVRDRTDAGTPVLAVNMAESPGARSALGYYSGRKIIGSAPREQPVETALAKDLREAHTLVWLPQDGKGPALPGGLAADTPASFTVDGHRFAWLNADQAGQALPSN